MRVSHAVSAAPAVFDEANLIAHAGLVPALRLAEQAGLHDLVTEHVHLSGAGAAFPAVKVAGLVAGMLAGADCIDDMDVLRHGGTEKVFTGLRAPSTYGTFLRAFTHGHIRQADAVAARFLTNLAAQAPLLPGADQLVHVDLDDTIRQTYGYAKQGAGFGYSGVKGLNAMILTASTPTSAPAILATRLRRGSVASAKGGHKLLADGLAILHRSIAAATGVRPGLVVVRADAAYYSHAVIAAASRAGARFSITARLNQHVRQAIASIPEDAWTPIRYPDAIFDEAEQRWISDAEVAEVAYTAFTSRRKAEHVSARLIVRRVRRLNPASAAVSIGEGQGELFAIYRHHAVLTDSPLSMLDAEADHRRHAVIESVIADLKDSALAHLPSGKFHANAAWLVLAAIAHNLTRALAALAGDGHHRARTATIRRKLIAVPARIASSARRVRLHLPTDWPWRTALEALFSTPAPPVRC